jgi:hypothetical protein
MSPPASLFVVVAALDAVQNLRVAGGVSSWHGIGHRRQNVTERHR